MTIGTILSALAAIPSILKYVESFASAVTLWFVERQNNETLSAISDAAALAANAKTDADRFKAAQSWQSALSRARESSS